MTFYSTSPVNGDLNVCHEWRLSQDHQRSLSTATSSPSMVGRRIQPSDLQLGQMKAKYPSIYLHRRYEKLQKYVRLLRVSQS